MDALLIAFFLLLTAASVATVRWLLKAPLGHEDEQGFHAVPQLAPQEDLDAAPIGANVSPQLLPRGLSRIP